MEVSQTLVKHRDWDNHTLFQTSHTRVALVTISWELCWEKSLMDRSREINLSLIYETGVSKTLILWNRLKRYSVGISKPLPPPFSLPKLKNTIIYYIIKVGFRSRGCAKWLHQIAENFLDLKKNRYFFSFYLLLL